MGSDFFPAAIAFWNADDGVIDGTTAGSGAGSGTVFGYTNDGGTTWHVTHGAGDETPGRVTAVPGTTIAWATVGICPPHATVCTSWLLYSPDDGHSWGPPPSDEGRFVGVSFTNAQVGWGIAVTTAEAPAAPPAPPSLVKSVDSGRSWHAAGSPCTGITGETPASVSAPKPHAVYVLCTGQPGTGLQAKSVVRSRDGGLTWQTRVSVPFLSRKPVGGLGSGGYASGIAFMPDGTGYLWEARGGFFKSTDGGKTWTPLALAQAESHEVRSVWFISDTEGFALVQDIQQGDMRLVKTFDGGASWSEVRTWALPEG